MKKEELLEIGLTDEQASKVFALNGVDVEREKAKTTAAKADLADAQAKLTTANTELDTLKKSNGDIAAVQKQLSELQTKYDTDTAALKGQMADRDYSDAISKAIKKHITEKGDHLSSKAVERDFTASLKEKKLEIKDGELVGFEDFLKAYREADQNAIVSGKPAPSFGERRVGGGCGQPQSTGETFAEQLGKASAAQSKAANDIISGYLKGDF